MTTGSIMFFSGVGLLVFTGVLGVIFWVKRPKYVPSSLVYGGEPDPAGAPGAAGPEGRTELIAQTQMGGESGETVLLPHSGESSGESAETELIGRR